MPEPWEDPREEARDLMRALSEKFKDGSRFQEKIILGAAALAVIFLGMTAAYLVHYFRLENGVQRWYGIARELDERVSGESLGPTPDER